MLNNSAKSNYLIQCKSAVGHLFKNSKLSKKQLAFNIIRISGSGNSKLTGSCLMMDRRRQTSADRCCVVYIHTFDSELSILLAFDFSNLKIAEL